MDDKGGAQGRLLARQCGVEGALWLVVLFSFALLQQLSAFLCPSLPLSSSLRLTSPQRSR